MVWHSERERCLVVFRRVELADPHQERRDNTLDILLYLYIYCVCERERQVCVSGPRAYHPSIPPQGLPTHISQKASFECYRAWRSMQKLASSAPTGARLMHCCSRRAASAERHQFCGKQTQEGCALGGCPRAALLNYPWPPRPTRTGAQALPASLSDAKDTENSQCVYVTV